MASDRDLNPSPVLMDLLFFYPFFFSILLYTLLLFLSWVVMQPIDYQDILAPSPKLSIEIRLK